MLTCRPASEAKRSRDEEWTALLPVAAAVNLRNALQMKGIKEKVPRSEVAINLDQDVMFANGHWGTTVPVILASISHLWGVVRGRPYTPEDPCVGFAFPFPMSWLGSTHVILVE